MGDFAFNELNAQELFAVCDPANTASANVMKRLGMQEVGIQRWYGKDLLTYRIEADQWVGQPNDSSNSSIRRPT